MQGIAAHDAIEEFDRSHDGAPAAARLPGTHRCMAQAKPRHPEPHGPSAIERELGEALHPERNTQLGHPGVDCRSLPAAHAHRLPEYSAGRDVQHPEEREAPLLVAVDEAAAVEAAPAEPEGEAAGRDGGAA